MDDPVEGHGIDKCESDGHTSDSSIRDFNGLTDIYWVINLFYLLYDGCMSVFSLG